MRRFLGTKTTYRPRFCPQSYLAAASDHDRALQFALGPTKYLPLPIRLPGPLLSRALPVCLPGPCHSRPARSLACAPAQAGLSVRLPGPLVSRALPVCLPGPCHFRPARSLARAPAQADHARAHACTRSARVMPRNLHLPPSQRTPRSSTRQVRGESPKRP